jgi:hypothetical protein
MRREVNEGLKRAITTSMENQSEVEIENEKVRG